MLMTTPTAPPDNTVIAGDCVVALADLPAEYIDLTVTSPPYDGLRDYQGYVFDPELVAAALYRVTALGGVVVWVVGDAVVKGGETGSSFRQAVAFQNAGFRIHDTMIFHKNTCAFPANRSGNRYSQVFEFMFVFSKGAPKTATLICDKPNKWAGYHNWGTKTDRQKDGTLTVKPDFKPVPEYSPRNNVWKYTVGGGFGQRDKAAYGHPATFPEKLAEDHIATWSKPGDIVLDPMCGSGTTCLSALRLGRRYIGIDISEEYCELTRGRLEREQRTDG